MGKHYVPQFLLKGFTKSGTFSAFDRRREIWFRSQPKSVANEHDLWPDDVEIFVTDTIELPALTAIERLRSKARLTAEDRVHLARYIAFLIKRVPAGRDRFYDTTPQVGERIRRELNARLVRPEQRDRASQYIDTLIAERPPALWHGSVRVPTSERFIGALTSMEWRILHTDSPQFLSSDNPVHFFSKDGIGKASSELTLSFGSTSALLARRSGTSRTRHVEASPYQIRELNRRTVHNATRFVFAQSHEPWMDTFVKKDHRPVRGM